MYKHLITCLSISLFIGLSGISVNGQKEISLESIYREYKFYPHSVSNIRSMNDGLHYTIMTQGKYIQKFSYKTGDFIAVLLDLTQIEEPGFSSFSAYEFSADESKILLTTDRRNIFRHSYVAEYYIYDTRSKKLTGLSENGMQQIAEFSPDGNKVAYVRDNNLFVKELGSGKEKQLTDDGEHNKIINGIPDWVYEEEFAFNKAFYWSPDSKYIAYFRFDEEDVKEFNLTMFEGLYPSWFSFKYPKAGEKNSDVEIWTINLETGRKQQLDTGSETDQYIPRIKWTKEPAVVSILRLNRLQNKLEVLHSNAGTGKSGVVYTESEEQYIAEVSDESVIYLENGEEFIIVSERDGYRHFYLYNYHTASITAITSGEFDITGFLGFDNKTSTLYYTSCENSPLRQDVYSIQATGKKKKRLSSEAGWNTAEFSKNFEYFINNYSNINQPLYVSLHDKKGKLIRVLEDNSEMVSSLEEYGFSKTEFFSFKNASDIELYGYMIKPSDFDESKKYPLFIYVYGGPESQNVRDSWSYNSPWFQMLVQKGYIVACIDNRGTDNRGEEFRKSTYMQLGKYETVDQTEAAIYLGGMDYIDESRIGIYGASYGGYMSLSCLFKSPDVFKLAISMAPVTNWRYYDTIYTERFMRTPQENPDGYDHNSPMHFTDGMEGKLLLIHGMADDNVHLQNSAELVKALVDSNKQFDMVFYPNKNHGIRGGNYSFHVYSKMTEFVLENL